MTTRRDIKDGDGSRKSPSVAMGVEETEAGAGLSLKGDEFGIHGTPFARPPFRTRPGEISALGATVDNTVIVPRTVIAEALEQIEATFEEYTEADHENDWMTGTCKTCGERVAYGHKKDCRYVRVRDALKGFLDVPR
jgi:hypothetical protein